MNGFELFLLGRKLTKIGEEAIPRVAGFHRLPSSVRSVLIDVLEHPNTSISEITARTGFPQSQVSWSVTKLREGGALETAVDREDRRRTLVRPARRRAEHRAAAPIDAPLAAALGTDDQGEVGEVVALLEGLAARLAPKTGLGGGAAAFDAAYAGTPPWDIGRPQPALLELAEAGTLRGRVLDAGCGTGEHVLMAARLGLPATGIDAAPPAIAIAQSKARDRGVDARFLVWDALELSALGEQFDTVLDSGLFHVFDDGDRGRYVEGLRAVLSSGGRYFMLCFSDQQPGDWGPRRVTEQEIRASFAKGWKVDAIEPARFDITVDPTGAHAWRVQLTRT